MNDKNELSDIVLNKGNGSGPNKKIILAVATLGVILILVVMLMSSMNSGSNDNLPQAVLPPKPQKEVAQNKTDDEPLFQDVKVIQDDASSDADLDKIAQKLKQESQGENAAQPQPKQTEKVVTATQPVEKKVHPIQKEAPKKPVVHKHKTKKSNSHVLAGDRHYYIQVGSFSKYKPNKKFLDSIHKLGYSVKYHKVGNLNKVLVGPFTQSEAAKAKKVLRSKVEPGAFLVKL